MRIYTDLDNTLVNPVTDDQDNVIDIIPRPGAQEFIKKLARDGDLWLITAATRGHADNALKKLQPASKLFRGVYSIEDMDPVKQGLETILKTPNLTVDEQIDLWQEMKPLFPPGIVFDDFPVGSWMYLLKAASVGIMPDRWIQVEHFGNGIEDEGGLPKAYQEFRRRFPNLLYMGQTSKRQKPLSGRMLRA